MRKLEFLCACVCLSHCMRWKWMWHDVKSPKWTSLKLDRETRALISKEFKSSKTFFSPTRFNFSKHTQNTWMTLMKELNSDSASESNFGGDNERRRRRSINVGLMLRFSSMKTIHCELSPCHGIVIPLNLQMLIISVKEISFALFWLVSPDKY